MKQEIIETKDSETSADRWRSLFSVVEWTAFIITGTLLAALASLLASSGLRTSFSEVRIRPEYVPFAATVLSAVVGLTVIFFLARTFYKRRVQASARLIKKVRTQEAKLFELAAGDFESIVSAHGRR